MQYRKTTTAAVGSRGSGLRSRPSGDGLRPPSYHKPARATAKVRIFCENGRVAGVFDKGSGTFTKRLRPEHLLKHPPGIANDVSVLRQLAALNCETMRVVLVETGEVLKAQFSAFAEHGEYLNRNHGPQVVLRRSYWRNAAEDAAQPALFSEGF